MASWHAGQTRTASPKVVIVIAALAVLLVAAVPVALFAGLILMLLGHVIGGLALFGGSVLAAVAAIGLAGLSSVRYARKLFSGQGLKVLRLNHDDYTFLG
jgi:uncharacterized membrane protein YdjX (TVP38/TMEM64 family)